MLLLLAGCLSVMVASVTAEKTIYGKLGDEVTLEPGPGSVTSKIILITWKVGLDLAAEWDGGVDGKYFRHFNGRSNLNTLTGELKITGLVFNDSDVYTPEINGRPGTPIHLIVISAVPKPTVEKFCQEEKSECKLICNGNTTGAEPVTYGWTLDNVVAKFPERIYTITEESSEISEFSCKMTNPVSEDSSDPFFISSSTTMSRKIITGVIVMVSLLAIVMLPVVFHRIRTGECFYEKDSMPWERDFWKKKQANVTESNGNATSPTIEEKQPMTES